MPMRFFVACVAFGFLAPQIRAQENLPGLGDFLQTTDGTVWHGDVRIRYRLIGRPRILADSVVFDLGQVAFFRDRGSHFGVYAGRRIVQRTAEGRIEIYSASRRKGLSIGPASPVFPSSFPVAQQELYLFKQGGNQGFKAVHRSDPRQQHTDAQKKT